MSIKPSVSTPHTIITYTALMAKNTGKIEGPITILVLVPRISGFSSRISEIFGQISRITGILRIGGLKAFQAGFQGF